MNTEQIYTGESSNATPFESTASLAPQSQLSITLRLCLNSAISGTSEAQLVSWALQHYKQAKYKHLLKEQRVQGKTVEDFTIAADIWHEIKLIEELQEQLTQQSIDVAEQNYWKSMELKQPATYASVRQHQVNRSEELVNDYLQDFNLTLQ
ncbi:hypothetical protein [Spirosoma sp. 48-14]|uniref:hypothetical protein n=1 Tax=Spirosoma sp. 48-14 TaxID=1895854 RepID=UPI0009686BD7|nr:hypothetical protein [Spirosoma sp. 48-14]OJW74276.1 MAG: hypothetical protein BGO59_14270 [Spirosoma sp. 48-14]